MTARVQLRVETRGCECGHVSGAGNWRPHVLKEVTLPPLALALSARPGSPGMTFRSRQNPCWAWLVLPLGPRPAAGRSGSGWSVLARDRAQNREPGDSAQHWCPVSSALNPGPAHCVVHL